MCIEYKTLITWANKSFTNMSVYDKAAQRRQDAPKWKKILAKELLKPKLKGYVRRRVYSSAVDDT